MSDPVKRDPILNQFSMITRPYTRLNGLKTIPRRVARIFRGGRGVRINSEDANFRGVRGQLPRENFRKFELPETAFRAFS